MARSWQKNRFSAESDEPLGPMANFLDLMLVFACGLIAALIAMSEQLQDHFQQPSNQARYLEKKIIETGKEIPESPLGRQGEAEGFEAVGQVFRDPKTGKLILIGD
tara:strand:+ start:51659 stop:51976 length:318 start_codon:yes stop_codon:yes gene_type:complete